MPARDSNALQAVVAATDFSRPADTALSYALIIARVHGAVLHLVHAVSRALPFVGRLEPFSRLEQMSTGAENRPLKQLKENLQSPDQQIETHLLHDRPSVATLEVAERVGAGLIVLGSRGQGGFRHLLLGSTAERVAQRAECPVLTVPPEAKKKVEHPRRILIATDFSDESDAALPAVHRLFEIEKRRVEIQILTVLHTPLGLEQSAAVNQLWQDYVNECRSMLDERLELLAGEFASDGLSTQTLLREGIPAEQIVRVAQEEEVDLIAMGIRGAFAAGRPFIGSVSKRVIQTAPCPVLTVPPSPTEAIEPPARSISCS